MQKHIQVFLVSMYTSDAGYLLVIAV